MAEQIISIESPSKTLTVELVGVKYEIKPIKAAIAVQMAKRFKDAKNMAVEDMEEAVKTIVGAIFGKQATKVSKRFLDPDDSLDYEHVFELMTALTEAKTANPTT